MRIRTTSTQRTYRYVRLALIGAAVFLAIGVGLEFARGDGLPSVSATYYTPAGPVFVGALSATALALLALSGRSLEQGLLDIAAVLALVIAYVPTTISSNACADGLRCVPPEVRPTVANNAVAVASVVLLGAVAAGILARVQGTASRGVALTVGVIVVLVAGGAAWALAAPGVFLAWAHEIAAVAFFVRLAYAAVAVAIVLTLVLLVIGVVSGVERTGFPVVLVGESAALALFAIFWLVQTVELWNDADPTLRE